MSNNKQAGLSGSYYGPAIPPDSYHRPGRGRGCAGGCFCCLLKLLLKLVLVVVTILGLAALIIWLIFRPINKFKFHVTDASLTQFNLAPNNTLYYNLAINMTIRNPNKKIGVRYDHVEARAYFEDQRFGSVTLGPFYQGHKNSTTLSPTFKGQSLLVSDDVSEVVKEYGSESVGGVYSIDIEIRTKIRFKLGKFTTKSKWKPKISCELKVPLKGSKANTSFKTTKCEIDY